MPTGFQEVLTYLRGGLNTALDPSNIGDTQLQEATGMEYRPPRLGLFAVQGRSRYDATNLMGGSRMHGLVFAQFDVSATSVEGHRLVAFAGSSAFGASANGQIGVFQTIKRDFTVGITSFADGVHYGNNWYFWNGTDASWQFPGTSLIASAVHGFQPINSVMTAVATAGAFTSDIGTYDLWMTEYFGDGPLLGGRYDVKDHPALEGTFIPVASANSVKSLTLSATALSAAVTFPSPVNTSSWFRVYTSVGGGRYPYGFQVGADQIASSVAGTIISSYSLISSIFTNNAIYPVVQPPGGVGVAQNEAPPKPWDMTVFQDSLVMIDRDDRQRIKYSVPDGPHYFPSTYYIPFETEFQDTLNALTVCNNALLVFSSFYGYRVDDLPRATDGDEIGAARSRAKEPFSWGHGCVSPMGTTICQIFGSGQLCFFVCRDGIHVTDGFKTDYASLDLDWEATVDIPSLNRARLLNNPKRHRVEFYYADFTDNTKWKRLDFYYHPLLLDKGDGSGFPRFPMLGPTDVPGPAATLGIFNNDWRVWTGSDFSASAFIEGTGTSDGAQLVDVSGTINKRWKGKDHYFGGIGHEFEIERIYADQATITASGSYTTTGTFKTDDLGQYIATGTLTQSNKGALPVLYGNHRSQMVSLRGAKDDSGAWQELNYLVFVVKDPQRLMSAKSNV